MSELWRVMIRRHEGAELEVLMGGLSHTDACRLMHRLRDFDIRCCIEWE